MDIILLLLLSFLNLSSKALGIHVQFFGNSNFTGLMQETNATTENCVNIINKEVNSIKTDTCLVVYKHSNCQSWSSAKILPGSSGFYGIKSFQQCGEIEGGSQLNIDITKFFNPVDPVSVPEVVKQFKDVCTCVNILEYVQLMKKWSINNHGNELLAYFQPDCSHNKFKPILIKAGNSIFSTNMHMYERIDEMTQSSYKIHSLGPDPHSLYFKTNCRLPSLVREKFHHLEEIIDSQNLNMSNLQQKHIEDHNIINISILTLQKHNDKLENLASKLEQLERKLDESELQQTQGQTKIERLMQKVQEESKKMSNEFQKLENKHTQLENQFAVYKTNMDTKLQSIEEKLNAYELKLDRCQKNVNYMLQVGNTPKNVETNMATWVKDDADNENSKNIVK